jgi:hypothetical protein
MKTRNLIGGLVLAAVVTAGAAGTAIAQAGGSSPTPSSSAPTTAPAPATGTAGKDATPAVKGARKEFVCGHQDQLADLLAQRKALQASRLTLEKEARQAAVAAHADAMVAKIDKRIAQTTKAQAEVATRTQKLTAWEAKHCTG